METYFSLGALVVDSTDATTAHARFAAICINDTRRGDAPSSRRQAERIIFCWEGQED